MQDTTERDTSGSYLDLHLEIDNEGRLSTTLYNKIDDINFNKGEIITSKMLRSPP